MKVYVWLIKSGCFTSKLFHLLPGKWYILSVRSLHIPVYIELRRQQCRPNNLILLAALLRGFTLPTLKHYVTITRTYYTTHTPVYIQYMHVYAHSVNRAIKQTE
jgi:hypothetical protein